MSPKTLARNPDRPKSRVSRREKEDVRLAEAIFRFVAARRRNRNLPMPFTVGFLQHWSGMGEHRAARAINALKKKKVLVEEGFYTARTHGYRVTLYVLPHVVVSVRRKRAVKPWWEHPLFGNPEGEPPDGISKRLLFRWKTMGTG